MRKSRRKFHRRLCFDEAARILNLSNKERRKLTQEYKKALKEVKF